MGFLDAGGGSDGSPVTPTERGCLVDVGTAAFEIAKFALGIVLGYTVVGASWIAFEGWLSVAAFLILSAFIVWMGVRWSQLLLTIGFGTMASLAAAFVLWVETGSANL